MKLDIRPVGHAKLSYLRISPRKVRLVANLVRGKEVLHAERQLQVVSKRSALPILKLLRSAISSAKEEERAKGLYISKIRVDQGPPHKRFRARARGRSAPINKLTSHVHIEVAEKK